MTTPKPDIGLHEAHRRRHLSFGWWLIASFSLLGLVLETLHGFKVPWYMAVTSDTRRSMLTLGHAHGTLVGLLHLAYAFTVPQLKGATAKALAGISIALSAGSVLLPVGFVLGGLWTYGGDPGLGVVGVPIGAGLLVLCLAAIAVQASRR